MTGISDQTAREGHLIWMAGVSRDGIHGTDWHLSTAMSRHAPILWVDPPLPLRPMAGNGGRVYLPRPALSVVDERTVRLTPVAPPGLSRLGIRSTTAPLVRSQVRWAVRRLGIRSFAVVATYLDDLLGRWGPNVVNVLYGTDDYVAGAALMGLSARHLRKQERRALHRADVVAAVSPELSSRWAGLGANPVVIPNGCWPSNGESWSAPVQIPDLPRPVVGLVGQLSDRIDLTVLEAIADSGISLLIVGPLDPRWGHERFRAMIGKPHVHYAGPVPAAVVPAYLRAIDIGITPYREMPFNRASFPLKTLEYLAVGIPVVSADLPAARWLREDLAQSPQAAYADQVLALVGHAHEFASAIRRIAAGELHPAPADTGRNDGLGATATASQCAAFAARHTWPRRADALASVIGLA